MKQNKTAAALVIQHAPASLVRFQRRAGFPLLCVAAAVLPILAAHPSSAKPRQVEHWVGTWAAAPQRTSKGQMEEYRNQTLRLVVHTSAGGRTIRVRLSNVFGELPLFIGRAHVARRTSGSKIDAAFDRALTFDKQPSVTIPAGSLAISDPVELDVPALSDLAISLFFPEPAQAGTVHILARQTNYVSTATGDATAAADFPVLKTINSWPFVTGVDVLASSRGAAIVAFGSSLTDGDGSTRDTNRRWPDVLAERLQRSGATGIGILNEGIIGNRLLSDSASPRQSAGPPPLGPVFDTLGPALGEAGVKRFERDVISQPGVKYVILALGVNDMLFPGTFVPAAEAVTARELIAGNRQLVAAAHSHGIRAIGTTIPPFEHALFRDPPFNRFYSVEKEKIRQEVNAWIRSTHEFDGVIDFDAAVRDPGHPTQILPAYDSGDHLHVNNDGNVAQGNAVPLALFRTR
ncbi:MAG: SGNH/GDSL hydrolase family protein [Acidobacteria bacterium]|nr:SGNH/GDSL hydrolase family protein [Acidobacteriota bacterium]